MVVFQRDNAGGPEYKFYMQFRPWSKSKDNQLIRDFAAWGDVNHGRRKME